MTVLEITAPFNLETAAPAATLPSREAIAAFFTACEGGDRAGIRAFAKDHPGYINVRRGSKTGLMFAADGRFDGAVKLLLELGADANLVEDNGMTALLYASARRNKNVVQALLDAKANVGACTDDNKTVLYFAAANNCCELLELFLNNGAARVLDKADATGATAVWKAIYYGYDKAADLLVGRGALLDAVVDGETLIDMAKRRGFRDAAKLEEDRKRHFADLETGMTGGLFRRLQVKGPLKLVKVKRPASQPPTKAETWRASTRNGCRDFKF